MTTRPIVVVGSINIDLVVKVERLPLPGETILGAEFRTHPGGKGANQAGAVARLGYPVFMVGRVGSDTFGEDLLAFLDGAGVNTSCVRRSEGSTGTAAISVTPDGENSIIVAPGANGLVNAADIDDHLDLIRSASVVLAQLEIPPGTVEHLAEVCAREHVPLLLDPAPAQALSPELLRRVSWITPNEVEARQLGGPAEGGSRDTAEQLMALGVGNVVLKMGEQGVYLATSDGVRRAVPAFPVRAVDTTGAGDAFNGAFAVGLSRGMAAVEAAEFAAAVAAISVTRAGALPSMPSQPEVDAFLEKRLQAQQEFAL
jgi:ribokinase